MCTATGNLDHSLNQDAVKVPKQNCVGGPITSVKHGDTLRISLLFRGFVPFMVNTFRQVTMPMKSNNRCSQPTRFSLGYGV